MELKDIAKNLNKAIRKKDSTRMQNFAADPNTRSNEHKLLAEAADRNYYRVIAFLITQPRFFDNAHLDNNRALYRAARAGHAKVIAHLAMIPKVRENINKKKHHILKAAIKSSCIPAVKELLALDAVKQVVQTNLSRLLMTPVYSKDWDMVKFLLEISHGALHDIHLLQEILKNDSPKYEEIKRLALRRPVNLNNSAQHLNTTQAWLKSWNLPPIDAMFQLSPVESIFNSFVTTNINPEQAAILFLSFSLTDKKFQTEIAETRTGTSEPAYHNKLRWHFADTVKPAYENRFNELGGVTGIEKLIKKHIITQISLFASAEIKSEIQARKENILQGVQADLEWTRNTFISNDNIYEIAWRAFNTHPYQDQNITCYNLLTPPSRISENHYFFNCWDNSHHTLKHASDGLREYCAYTYLIVTDPQLNDEQKNVLTLAFFRDIAFSQRVNYTTVVDTPIFHCETFLLLHDVMQLNPHVPLPTFNFYACLNSVADHEIKKIITVQFLSCETSEDAITLRDALTMMNETKAMDIILGRTAVDRREINFQNRRNLFNATCFHQALSNICNAMKAQYMLTNSCQFDGNPEVNLHIYALLVTIGTGDMKPFIENACEARIKALQVAEEHEITTDLYISSETLNRNQPVMSSNQFNPSGPRF